jgi:hypothetical protein
LLLGLVLVNSNIHQADDDEEQGKRWTWSFKFNDVPLFTYWKWWTILPCPKMPRLAFHVCRVPGVPRLLRPRRLRPRHQPRLPRVPPRPRHAVWHDRVDPHDHESSGEEVLHQQTHHRWIEWNDGGWSEDVCRASQELLIGAWYQWSIKRA